MNNKAKEARRAYQRAWAKNNPEKVKASQERYWNKQAAKAAEAAAEQPAADADELSGVKLSLSDMEYLNA